MTCKHTYDIPTSSIDNQQQEILTKCVNCQKDILLVKDPDYEHEYFIIEFD